MTASGFSTRTRTNRKTAPFFSTLSLRKSPPHLFAGRPNKPSGRLTTHDAHTGGSFGFFLYEIRSKRRVLLSPLNLLTEHAEWSRDGFQIFFTGADSSRRYATYHMFWDGIGLQKYVSGTSLAIGP